MKSQYHNKVNLNVLGVWYDVWVIFFEIEY